MFQGSKHIESDAHFRLLAGAGATGVNGTTNFDRTNYFETMPSNQLELALWLESDRMGYLLETVDQAKLSNQQDVVRNERRQSTENRPYGIVEEAMFQALFPKGHPYHGVVIGSHADIQAAKLDDVREFFRQYYAPNNATIAIAGDIDKAATKKLIEKYFGSLKRGPAVPPVKVQTPVITVGAPARRRRSRRAAADLHGVDHAAVFQRRGRRRRHRGAASSDRAASAASTRSSSTKSRSRRTSTRISIRRCSDRCSDRGDGAARADAAGARGRHQRRARAASRQGADGGGSRSRAQRARDADLQRTAARRRIRRRCRPAESVQPLRRKRRITWPRTSCAAAV